MPEENLEKEKVEEVEKTEATEVETKEEPIVENDPTVEEKKYHSPVDYGGSEKFYQIVEENQKGFSTYFKKNKNLNLIIMFAFMALIIGVLFGLSKVMENYFVVLIVIVIAYFVILYFFSKYTKKKLNDEANRIILEYFINLDSYIVDNDKFTNVEFNVDDKMDEELIKSLRIVKDINHIGGRDLIRGELCGHSFTGGDVLIKTMESNENGKNQQFIVFLGKLFVVDLKNVVSEGRVVIYLKGKGANGPTDIEDLTKREDVLSDKYDVYASCDLYNVLTSEIKEVLESFEINETLIDMFITIDPEKVSVGLSYSDAVMRVPLFDALDKNALEQYKNDTNKMIEFIDKLSK